MKVTALILNALVNADHGLFHNLKNGFGEVDWNSKLISRLAIG